MEFICTCAQLSIALLAGLPPNGVWLSDPMTFALAVCYLFECFIEEHRKSNNYDDMGGRV